MGLNASVFCDCYESSRMTRPPQPEFVYLDEMGQVSCRADHPDADQCAFDEWLARACPHGPLGGGLVSHRLGNLSLIEHLANLLAGSREQFPILLTKVLYDGTHSGDCIHVSDLDALNVEIQMLHKVHIGDGTLETVTRQFERQMVELVTAANAVKKPIVFL
jgi:hypothetical protein